MEVYDELYEKLQKFTKLLMENLDADHLGLIMVEAGLKQFEMDMFLNSETSLTNEDREAYEIRSNELEKARNEFMESQRRENG